VIVDRVPEEVTLLCGALGRDPAALAALELGRYLHARGARIDTVSLWDGGHHGPFAALGPVHVVNPSRPAELDLGPDRLDLLADDGAAPIRRWDLRRVGSVASAATADAFRIAHRHAWADRAQGAFLRMLLRKPGRPIWVAGAEAARLLHYVPDDRPVVQHEPEGTLDPDDPEDRALLRDRPDAWVVATTALESAVAGPATVIADVALLPDAPAHRTTSRARLLRDLHLPEDTALVGSLGEVDWWEVSDAFVQVAWELVRRPDTERVHLVWLAGQSTDRELWPLHHDLHHAGLEDRVHVVRGLDPAPLDALAALDVVLLTRRGRVRFPQLRQVEGVGVPIVRWALPDATPPEEAGHHLGHTALVRHLDERSAADAVLRLLQDPDASAAALDRADQVRAISGISRGGPKAAAVLSGARRRAPGTKPAPSA
jgi:hypothetical protein